MPSSTAYDLCSTAWADKQGYVSFSIRDHTKDKREPGYWKDIMYQWPQDHERIKAFLDKSQRARQDVYWSPAMYSGPRRSKDLVLPTDVLWADLDEVDPDGLPSEFSPTASWSTSPGRYQALWRLSTTVAPELHEKLNQALTYNIGADKGGWDLTQVLRIPGTRNHKYEDVTVQPPHINGAKPMNPIDLAATIASPKGVDTSALKELPDAKEVLRKVRKHLPPRARQLLRAKPSNQNIGQRSERLWELECLLAETGLGLKQIVSLCQASAWNKFKGRHDELSRLSTEARKAFQHVGRTDEDSSEAKQRGADVDATDPDEAQFDEDPLPRPQSWSEFDRDHKPIRWLVADVWGEAEVGFISGHPKSYKSWLSLDLAVSVATGTRYLDSFETRKANVLLIQEEDPRVVIQDRLTTIAATKGLIWAKPHPRLQSVEMRYELPDNLYVLSGAGVQVTDEDWMDEVKQWVEEFNIELVIMDPLMMMAEGMDEFKAFDMMAKVLKPLKRLRAETGAAVVVVHHHTKTEKQGAAAMYGSVALWAWEEAALHLNSASPGRVVAERFSKHAQLSPLTITMGDIEAEGWHPKVQMGHAAAKHDDDLVEVISQFEGGATRDDIKGATGMGVDAITRKLADLEQEGKIESRRLPKPPGERGRAKKAWTVKKAG